jgi:hypothetical protein
MRSLSAWRAHAAQACVADVQVAAGLTEAAVSGSTGAARIMLFVGGPTTDGPGQVVAKELLEPIRSHKVRVHSTVHDWPAERWLTSSPLMRIDLDRLETKLLCMGCRTS